MPPGPPLPGFEDAAPGFDSPFELLCACHGRIARTLGLLARLRAHVRSAGADADARSAARDVLRYFDVAAPLHHEDEECHVFPVLTHPRADPELAATVARLHCEHRDMEAAWAVARPALLALAQGESAGFSAAEEAALDAFSALHGAHIRTEEDCVYPAARAALDAPALAAMGRDMRVRRGASR